MTQRQLQSGSAHMVVIMILIVGLIGALGYIFWNKLNQGPVVMKDSRGSSQKKSSDVQLRKACLEIEKMCFDYPESWTVRMGTNSNKDFPGDDTTITSKNGFILTASSGITGIGGTCDPDTQGSVIVVKTDELSIGGYGTGDRAPYESQKLHAVKIINVNQQQDDYRPSVLLTTDLDLATTGTKAGCEVGFFEGKKPIDSSTANETSGLMTFGASNDDNRYGAPSATEAEALARLESSEYEDAYKILTSVRYE